MMTAVMICLLLIEIHTYVFPATTILMKNCPTRTTINVSWLSILICERFPLILQLLPEHSQGENPRKGVTHGLPDRMLAHAPGAGTFGPEQIGLTHEK